MSEIANLRELLNDLEIDRDEWQARAERAEAERDRLAAQLAAAGWHPGTKAPPTRSGRDSIPDLRVDSASVRPGRRLLAIAASL